MMVKKENSWYMCEGDWLYHFQTSTTAYNLQRKKTCLSDICTSLRTRYLYYNIGLNLFMVWCLWKMDCIILEPYIAYILKANIRNEKTFIIDFIIVIYHQWSED